MLRIALTQSGTPLNQIPPRVQAAAQRAVTGLAFDVRDAIRAGMAEAFDNPTTFTLNAFRVTGSGDGSATVWAMDRQAKYLFWEIEGGDRASKAFEHKLGLFGGKVAIPVGRFASAYDAKPKTFVGRLIRDIEKGKADTSRFFVGRPRNGSRPEGVWYRTSKRRIHMVMRFEDSASYRERLDIEAIAQETVAMRWESQLLKAIART